MSTADNPRVGSSFQEFLGEEGICEEANAHAVKRVAAIAVGCRLRLELA